MVVNCCGDGPPVENKETILRGKKVWQNADATLPFAAQTVSFEDLGAVLYIVEYKMYSGNNGSYKSDIAFPKHATVLGSNYYDHNQKRFIEVTRNVTITESSAVFSDDSIDGEKGEYMVPVAIYAIYQ